MIINLEKMKASVKASMKSFPTERVAVFVMFLGLCSFPVLAAVDPFSDITKDISGYIPSVKKLIYVIAAIIALVGAFNIYHKMTNGDQDVKKTVMLVIGGCIGLLAMAEALPAFFGY